MQVLLTPGFEGSVEFNQRRLGKNSPDGGTSLNKSLEMGVSGHREGPQAGWWPHPRECAFQSGWEPCAKNTALGSEQAAQALVLALGGRAASEFQHPRHTHKR